MAMNQILVGDVIEQLMLLPDDSIDSVITSPPYWNLRQYHVLNQIGLEATLQEYVTKIADVFDQVRRVLKPAGTCFLNLGDSWVHNGPGARDPVRWPKQSRNDHIPRIRGKHTLPKKNLVGAPWRCAFALQDRGWILRQEIIWERSNCMPEAVKDRCTQSHERIFLLTKSPRYYWDYRAIQEPTTGGAHPRGHGTHPKSAQAVGGGAIKQNPSFSAAVTDTVAMRNKRSVWRYATKPAPKGSNHFAVFPDSLVTPMVLAGCPAGGVVLDIFMGSGTVGVVAQRLGRNWLGIELNPQYAAAATTRIQQGARCS